MTGKVMDAAMLLLKKDSGRVSALKKRVDTLYKLAEDMVYETETDSDPAYAKTVPAGAEAAEMESIGGKTVRWNQQVTNGNFAAGTADWVSAGAAYGTISAADGVLTYTVTVPGDEWYRNGVGSDFREPLPSEHKCLFCAFARSSAATTLRAYMRRGNAYPGSLHPAVSVSAGEWTELQEISTTPSGDNITGFRIFFTTPADLAAGDTLELKNVSIVDLTAMFGAGNEPASSDDPRVAAIRAYASLHPNFDAGNLLHASVTQVVSRDTDAETIDTLEIPAGIRALEGYGQSAVGGSGNTLDLADGTYTEIGHYVDGTWTLLDEPAVTDVSGMIDGNMLVCEAGGTLTFASDSMQPVPNSVDYLIRLSEVDV